MSRRLLPEEETLLAIEWYNKLRPILDSKDYRKATLYLKRMSQDHPDNFAPLYLEVWYYIAKHKRKMADGVMREIQQRFPEYEWIVLDSMRRAAGGNPDGKRTTVSRTSTAGGRTS